MDSMLDFWDYLMRRKALFVALVAAFALSGTLGGAMVERMRKPAENQTAEEQQVEEEKTEPGTLHIPIRVPTAEELAAAEKENIEVPLTGGLATFVSPIVNSGKDAEDENKNDLVATWQGIVYATTWALIAGGGMIALLTCYRHI